MNSPLTIGLMALTVAAYALLQIMMLVRTSGRMRWAAAVPLLVMIPAGITTGLAFYLSDSLAPVLMLLLSPLSALYFLALTHLGTQQTMMPLNERKLRP